MLKNQVNNREFLEKTIAKLKKENSAIDIQLLEKTTGALYLLENLAKEKLEFIFKGGTSLILLLDEMKRFSVDIDIITEETEEKVKEIISNIIRNQNFFKRVEENIRINGANQRMRLQHYKFFFKSCLDNTEKYILLDVAYEKNLYPVIIRKKIKSEKLNIESDTYVNIPSIESILGDKLTVIAPNTTGISYDSNKELEIIKQLYDVDKLFDEAEKIETIKESFIRIANREIKYRKLNISYLDVLKDIEKFAIEIVYLQNPEHMKIINSGIRKFSNYRVERKFLIDREVLTASSKVLYLTKLLKRETKKEINKFNSKNPMKVVSESKIQNKQHIKRLKVIRKINIEAYYYIAKSIE